MTSEDDMSNLESVGTAVVGVVALMRSNVPTSALCAAVDRLVALLCISFDTTGPPPRAADYTEGQWMIARQALTWFGAIAAGINPDEGPDTVPPLDP
jgi:hypothetical protein